jgi:AraC-like DNA-binding protein
MAGLGFCIAYYWTVSWDLRGREPHAQETLPHPNVYLVFEDEKLVVSGVSTAKFSRLLRGKSRVFGVKFKPGGFRPYLKDSVSSITDVVKPAGGIFGADADAFESRLLAATAEEEMVAAADAFFRARIPKPDGSIALATNLVERILNRSEIKTVDRLAEDAGIAKRSLQRIFNEYVGVSPKWVIRRYRLHELVERLNSGEELDWPDVAVELGYFDQAHLINDFRSIVGYSPTRYQPGNAKD